MSHVGPAYESGDPQAIRQRSQRRRMIATLLAVAVLLFGAFWFAYSYYRNPPAQSSTRTPAACVTTTPAPVTINVYNATSRNGLAATTADQLRKRGFTVDKVANDPLKKAVKGAAEVRFGPKGAALAKAKVVPLIAAAAPVQDKRADETIDLVLGDAYKSLAALPTVTPTKTCR